MIWTSVWPWITSLILYHIAVLLQLSTGILFRRFYMATSAATKGKDLAAATSSRLSSSLDSGSLPGWITSLILLISSLCFSFHLASYRRFTTLFPAKKVCLTVFFTGCSLALCTVDNVSIAPFREYILPKDSRCYSAMCFSTSASAQAPMLLHDTVSVPPGDDPPMFRFTVDPQCWLCQCMQRSALVSVLFGPQIPLLPAVACYHILFASGEPCSVALSALAIFNSGLRTGTAHQKSVGNSMGHVYMTVQAITISGASTAQVAARGFYLECVINLLPNAGSVVTSHTYGRRPWVGPCWHCAVCSFGNSYVEGYRQVNVRRISYGVSCMHRPPRHERCF